MIDKIIENFMEQHKVPGMELGIVLNGQLAVAKGFGVKNINTGEKVIETSMFHNASISKTFVAEAIMQLWEQGLVDLDEKVVYYLPYFKIKDNRYKDITVRQMLSHTSGMPDIYDYEWDKPQFDQDSLEKYVRNIYDYELLWAPGQGYAYSNLSYEILGHLISKLSGLSFEDYMKQNILLPLGMECSSFFVPEIPKLMLTSPHIMKSNNDNIPIVNEYYPYNRIHGPSSSLCSNVIELSKYAIANINRGKFGDFQLLKEESYNQMWQPYSTTTRESIKVGLSWFIREYKGRMLYFHAGEDIGYRSNMVIIPQEAMAVITYFNCDYINPNTIMNDILDVLIK